MDLMKDDARFLRNDRTYKVYVSDPKACAAFWEDFERMVKREEPLFAELLPADWIRAKVSAIVDVRLADAFLLAKFKGSSIILKKEDGAHHVFALQALEEPADLTKAVRSLLEGELPRCGQPALDPTTSVVRAHEEALDMI